jgi:hypothetical protein
MYSLAFARNVVVKKKKTCKLIINSVYSLICSFILIVVFSLEIQFFLLIQMYKNYLKKFYLKKNNKKICF